MNWRAISLTLGGATLLGVFLATQGVIRPRVAEAQAPGAATRPSARFVALQPPAAGDNTYGNFLWVLDTATGDVVAYRISSLTGDDNKHKFWMTERLVTEEEYVRAQKK